jgi:hypothetical protein
MFVYGGIGFVPDIPSVIQVVVSMFKFDPKLNLAVVWVRQSILNVLELPAGFLDICQDDFPLFHWGGLTKELTGPAAAEPMRPDLAASGWVRLNGC